ncbi:MAG: hypothetical protein ACLFUG_07305 [Nitriliruptoraceae bacterium]
MAIFLLVCAVAVLGEAFLLSLILGGGGDRTGVGAGPAGGTGG